MMPQTKQRHKEYMRDYREQQLRVEELVILENDLSDLLWAEVIDDSEYSQKLAEELNDSTTHERAALKSVDRVPTPKVFSELPKMLMPLFERLTKNCVSEQKRRYHYYLSHFYYDLSPDQRTEQVYAARVKINANEMRKLNEQLDGAQELLLTEIPEPHVANDFLVRLERFCYVTKKLKEQDVSFYVASEVCGRAFLSLGDMVTLEELKPRIFYDSFQRPIYLPSNKFWSLQGRFKSHPFINQRGDCDWLIEWSMRERDLCLKDETVDKFYFTRIKEWADAYERFQLKAYTHILIEKLTNDQTFELLKKEKPKCLNDFDLETAIRSSRELVEKEEKDSAFNEEFEEEYGAKPEPEKVSEKGKVTILKAKLVEDEKE